MPALKDLKNLKLKMPLVHMRDTTLQRVGTAIGASCSQLQTLSIDMSFNDPPDSGNVTGLGVASVVDAAARCSVTSLTMNLYGNTGVGSSITVIGNKFRNFKALQSLDLQFYVINPEDSAAGDAFAADFGSAVASMRSTLTHLSLDMSCNAVSDTGIAAMGAGLACLKNISSANYRLNGCGLHVDDTLNCIVLGDQAAVRDFSITCLQCNA